MRYASAHVVHESRVLNAPVPQVWHSLTDPDLTQQYFFHARIESNWTAGSPIVFRSKFLGFISFVLRGRIIEIVPQRVLAYQLHHHRFIGAPKPGEFSTVRILLAPHGADRTQITVADDVGATAGAERRYTRSVAGWKKILDGLERTLGATTSP